MPIYCYIEGLVFWLRSDCISDAMDSQIPKVIEQKSYTELMRPKRSKRVFGWQVLKQKCFEQILFNKN